MNAKITYKTIYLYCLGLWFFFSVIGSENTISGFAANAISKIYRLITIGIKIILIFLMIKKNKRKDMAKSLFLIIIAELTSYFSGNQFMNMLFWFIAAGKRIEKDEAVKFIFFSELSSSLLIIILAIMGIINNISIVRDSGIIRHAFGFTHPNTLAARLLSIALLYIYLNRKKITFLWILLIICYGVGVRVITDSNTAEIVLVITALWVLLYLMNEKHFLRISKLYKLLLNVYSYMFEICLYLSFFLTFTSRSLINVLKIDTNSTLNDRISQMQLYWKYYSVKLFGQKLYYHGNNSSSTSLMSLYTLDNAFLYLLLGMGACTFIVFCFLYIGEMRYSKQKKEYMIIVILCSYAICGMTETTMIRFTYNFSLIFLMDFVWNYKFVTKIKWRKKNAKISQKV